MESTDLVIVPSVGSREELPPPRYGMVARDRARSSDDRTFIWVVKKDGTWSDESVLLAPKCRCGCCHGT